MAPGSTGLRGAICLKPAVDGAHWRLGLVSLRIGYRGQTMFSDSQAVRLRRNLLRL
jgi:hypothetical protein